MPVSVVKISKVTTTVDGTTTSQSSSATMSLTPPPPTPAAPDKKKTVGREAQIWRQDTSQDFSQGTLNNATITSSNELRLSLSLKPLSQSISSYIWCLAQDHAGNLYAGTGDDGIVYVVSSDGTMKPYFRTGELEVTSLAYDVTSGNLYAGTSPHGVIFQIDSSGKGTRLGTVGDKYVTALALDDSRSVLYAATAGGSGDLYTVSTTSPAVIKPLFTSPETHLLSLAVDPSGLVYAGGSPDGVIYSITPAGDAKVVYQSAQPNITALALDSQGNLYAGTSSDNAWNIQ